MIRANLTSNYASAAYVALTQIATIPIYLAALGDSQWGLMSWVLALSSAILIAESGVSIGVARSVSGSAGDFSTSSRHWRHLERRYLQAAAGIALLFLVLVPWSPRLLPYAAEHAHAVWMATGLMAAAQLTGALYRAFLVGRGQQVALNKLTIVFTTARHLIGYLAAVLGLGVVAVTCIFAIGFATEAWFRRRASLIRSAAFGTGIQSAFDGTPFTGALVLGLAGALGAMGSQIDKLWFARTIDSALLGYYAIASTLSLAMLQLVYPITTALMPSLARFGGSERGNMMQRSYMGLLLVLSLAWIGAAALQNGLLQVWLPSAKAASLVSPLFVAHLMGSSLNALCVPLYLALLARGRDKALLSCTVIALCTQLATLVVVTETQGAMAGAWAWCAFNCVQLGGYVITYISMYRNSHAVDR